MIESCFNLHLKVISAENLAKADTLSGKANAYVAVMLGGKRIGVTSTVKRSLSPVWNAEFSSPILNLGTDLVLKVYHNRYGRDECLGWVKINLQELLNQEEKTHLLDAILVSDMDGIEARGTLRVNVKVSDEQEMFHIAQVARGDGWQGNEEGSMFKKEYRKQIVTHLLKSYPTTELFEKEFGNTALFRRDVYKKDLAVDILDDCAGLLHKDNDVVRTDNKVYKYQTEFNTCTWMQIDRQGDALYHSTYPFTQGDPAYPLKVRLQCTNGFHCLSFKNSFAYWSAVMRLRAVFQTWTGETPDEDPEWLEKPIGDQFTSSLGTEAEVKCTFAESLLYNLQMTTLETPVSSVSIHLAGLSGMVLSADFTLPQNYDLKVDILDGQRSGHHHTSRTKLLSALGQTVGQTVQTMSASAKAVARKAKETLTLQRGATTRSAATEYKLTGIAEDGPDDEEHDMDTGRNMKKQQENDDGDEGSEHDCDRGRKSAEKPEGTQLDTATPLVDGTVYRLGSVKEKLCSTDSIIEESKSDLKQSEKLMSSIASSPTIFSEMNSLSNTHTTKRLCGTYGTSAVSSNIFDVTRIAQTFGAKATTTQSGTAMDGLYVTIKGVATPPFITTSKGGIKPIWNESINISISHAQLTGRIKDEIVLRMWDAAMYTNGLPTLIGEKNVPIRMLFHDDEQYTKGSFHDVIESGSAFISEHELTERTCIKINIMELTDLYSNGSSTAASADYSLERRVYLRARLVRWNGDSQKTTLSNWKCSVPLTGDDMSFVWPHAPQEEFAFTAADGLDWADYVCVEVMDVTNALGDIVINNNLGIPSVGEKCVAQGFIPIADFSFSHRRVEYTMHPGVDANSDTGARFTDLSTMVVALHKSVTESVTKDSDAYLTLKTRLSYHTVYNTYWQCSCVLAGGLGLCNEPPSEDLLIYPSFSTLILVDLNDELVSKMPLRAFLNTAHPSNTGTNDRDADASIAKQSSKSSSKRSRNRLNGSSSGSLGSMMSCDSDSWDISVYENETRASPFHNWEPSMSSRANLTNETGTDVFPYDDVADTVVPDGWQWTGDWRIDTAEGATDKEGWCYGMSFESIMAGYRRHQMATSHDNIRCFRRRHWTRPLALTRTKDEKMTENGSTTNPKPFLPPGVRGSMSEGYNSATSRAAVKKQFPHDIFRTCMERGEDLSSPAHIPYNQLQRVDVVTPTVLALHLVVTRFTGRETASGSEESSFAPVDVAVFIKGCPAQSLKSLIDERSQLAHVRHGIKDILSAGKFSRSTSNVTSEMSPASELVRDLDNTVNALEKEFYEIVDEETEQLEKLHMMSAAATVDEGLPMSPVHHIARSSMTAYGNERDKTKLGAIFTVDDMETSGADGVEVHLNDQTVAAASTAYAAATSYNNTLCKSARLLLEASGRRTSFSSTNRSVAHTSSDNTQSPSVPHHVPSHTSTTETDYESADPLPRINSEMVQTSADGSVVIMVDREKAHVRNYNDESIIRSHILHFREDLEHEYGSNLRFVSARPVEQKRMCIPNMDEIYNLMTRGHVVEGMDSYCETALIPSKASRKQYLARGMSRLHMYICVLLGFGLNTVHTYDVEEVRGICDFDVAKAKSLQLLTDDVVAGASDAIFSLLHTAETRVRETVLCGWYHRGGRLERCLELMVNVYYGNIVALLGRFFDLHGLEAVKGLESKIKLINFLVDQDDRFASVQRNALRPFRLQVSPEPVLSRCLNFTKLAQWYGGIVRDEMRTFISSTVDVWQKTARKNRENKENVFQSALPWEPIRRRGISGPFISMIPEDCLEALNQYVIYARPTGSEEHRHHDLLGQLDETLTLALIGAVRYLAHIQKEILDMFEWTTPLGQDESVDSGGRNPPAKTSRKTNTTSKSRKMSFLSNMGFTVGLGLRSMTTITTDTSMKQSKLVRRSQLFTGKSDKISEEDLGQLDEHIVFLVSVANDSIRLMSRRSIESFVSRLLGIVEDRGHAKAFFDDADCGGWGTAKDGGSGGSRLKEEIDTLSIPAYHSLGDLMSTALHSVSCIFFTGDGVVSTLTGEYLTKATATNTANIPTSTRKFKFFAEGTKDKKAFSNLSEVWRAATEREMQSPISRLVDKVIDEVAYTSEMVEPLCLESLVYICADKIAILCFLILLEINDDDDEVLNENDCNAFKRDVDLLEHRIKHDALASLPPKAQERAWERMKHTFESLHSCASLLTSPLDGAQFVLGIQNIFERSGTLSGADVMALGRMARLVIQLRLRRDVKEAEAALTNDNEKEDRALWRQAAEQMCDTSIRAMRHDARVRDKDGQGRSELKATGALVSPQAPLLRLVFGPISEHIVEEADPDDGNISMRSYSTDDSPAYALTSLEILQGSAAKVSSFLKDYLEKEEEHLEELRRRTASVSSPAQTPTSATSVAPAVASVNSARDEAVSERSNSSRRSVADQVSNTQIRLVVISGLTVTNILRVGKLRPKIELRIALVSSLTRYLDFDAMTWVASTEPVVVGDYHCTSWEGSDIVVPVTGALQGMDVVVAQYALARVYGKDLLVCHTRINLGFLSVSSIDGRRLSNVYNCENDKVAKAVAAEKDENFVKQSSLVLSMKIADESNTFT